MFWQKTQLKNRVFLLDEIRGFAILCMVLYHTVYDLLLLFPIEFPFFHSCFMNAVRDLFAGIFIFISGTACRFSRNNLKRGLLCLGFGMIMTLATWLILPEQLIVFGILHMLGCSMILFWLFRPLLDRIPKIPLLLLLGLLFLITIPLDSGFLGISGLAEFHLPLQIYRTNWLSPIGIYNRNFVSTDYFPLFPWTFLFLAGTVVGIWIKKGAFPDSFYRQHSRFLSLIGRNTIGIYLLHQPVIFGLLYFLRQFSQ